MLFKCRNKRSIGHQISLIGTISILIILFSFSGNIPAFGQIFPYSPYVQSYLPLASSSYINNYNPFPLTNFLNPYLGLYNPFSSLNSFASLNRNPFYPTYPQASIAGGLVPFTSFFANPFTFPYSAAAYFAAAAIPADVSGSWAGTWVSTFLAGGVITGDISMTLTQNGTEVAGTAVFLLNKILKYGAYVVGTVEGNTLTLTSSVVTSVTGTMVFDVEIIATVTDIGMEGNYVIISLATGLVAEEGTFTATRL